MAKLTRTNHTLRASQAAAAHYHNRRAQRWARIYSWAVVRPHHRVLALHARNSYRYHTGHMLQQQHLSQLPARK